MNGLMPRRAALFFALAALGAAVDLWTKSWIFGKLGLPRLFGDAERIDWLWEPYFGLQTSLNEGALFGIGQGKVWLFAGLSCFAIVAILYWLFVAGGAADLWLTTALGLVMGGVVGNLYDRLGLWWRADPEFAPYPQHAVRDWILLQYDGWIWPNFNIADSLLVCGAIVLMIHAWRTPALSPRDQTVA